MWTLAAGLPVLTAALAAVCVLWPAARRLAWVALTLAVFNVVLSPLSSGEWFYQRAEVPDYDQAVARGDFSAYRDLLGRHDPTLQPKMIGVAVALLVALALWTLLRVRTGRGRPVSALVSAAATGAVLLSALATVAAVYLVETGLGSQVP